MTSTENLTIRPLTRSDAAIWDALSGQIAGQVGVAPETFDRLTAVDALDRGAFIAVSQGVALGFATVTVTRSEHRFNSCWHLHEVQVLDAHRGQDIGARLVRAVYEAATSAGFLAVYWADARRHLRPRGLAHPSLFSRKVA